MRHTRLSLRPSLRYGGRGAVTRTKTPRHERCEVAWNFTRAEEARRCPPSDSVSLGAERPPRVIRPPPPPRPPGRADPKWHLDRREAGPLITSTATRPRPLRARLGSPRILPTSRPVGPTSSWPRPASAALRPRSAREPALRARPRPRETLSYSEARPRHHDTKPYTGESIVHTSRGLPNADFHSTSRRREGTGRAAGAGERGPGSQRAEEPGGQGVEGPRGRAPTPNPRLRPVRRALVTAPPGPPAPDLPARPSPVSGARRPVSPFPASPWTQLKRVVPGVPRVAARIGQRRTGRRRRVSTPFETDALKRQRPVRRRAISGRGAPRGRPSALGLLGTLTAVGADSGAQARRDARR